ncbi:MAG: hypothetical protein FRX49_07259 [Trebouxia sp. A1-2]|nr:MAG: hypothetical protein FRX49_07259 [Trebouxia sp. A1-2]
MKHPKTGKAAKKTGKSGGLGSPAVPEQQALSKSVQRLSTGKSSWKKWQWQAEHQLFDSASAFRDHVATDRLPAALISCLAHKKLKPSSSWAIKALHERMLQIEQRVAAYKQSQKEMKRAKSWHISRKSGIMNLIFTELLHEHEFLYNAFAKPVARSLAHLLPADIPMSEPPEEYGGSFVSFVVLDKAGDSTPASTKRITDWVEHNSADFCRLTSTEGPADKASDIVPFALLHSQQDGTKLAITQEWLHHLQNPGSSSVSAAGTASTSKAAPANSSDCIMRWIFDANPSPSIMPSLPGATGSNVSKAYDQLASTLRSVKESAAQLDKVEDLLKYLLLHRQHMAEWKHIKRQRDISDQQLPPKAMLCMLRQEYVVVESRMMHHCRSNLAAVRMFRLDQQLNQAEAEFAHLEKKEKAITRHAMPAALMDPSASQHQKATITAALQMEQSATKKSMADIGCVMMGLQDKQDIAEGDMQKGNRELLALKAWGGQIADLIEAVDDIIQGLDSRAATPGPVYGIGLYEHQLTELTAHFYKDIWPKLCKPEQCKAMHEMLQVQHAESMKHFEQGCAIVQSLMAQLVEAACDDPGAVLLPQLVLPLLRERLETKAKAHKDGKSADAISASGNQSGWDPEVSDLVNIYKTQTQECTSSVDDRNLGVQQCFSNIKLSNVDLTVMAGEEVWAYADCVDDLSLQALGPDAASTPTPSLKSTFLGNVDPAAAWLSVVLITGCNLYDSL